jgi:hypothetical protein
VYTTLSFDRQSTTNAMSTSFSSTPQGGAQVASGVADSNTFLSDYLEAAAIEAGFLGVDVGAAVEWAKKQHPFLHDAIDKLASETTETNDHKYYKEAYQVGNCVFMQNVAPACEQKAQRMQETCLWSREESIMCAKGLVDPVQSLTFAHASITVLHEFVRAVAFGVNRVRISECVWSGTFLRAIQDLRSQSNKTETSCHTLTQVTNGLWTEVEKIQKVLNDMSLHCVGREAFPNTGSTDARGVNVQYAEESRRIEEQAIRTNGMLGESVRVGLQVNNDAMKTSKELSEAVRLANDASARLFALQRSEVADKFVRKSIFDAMFDQVRAQVTALEGAVASRPAHTVANENTVEQQVQAALAAAGLGEMKTAITQLQSQVAALEQENGRLTNKIAANENENKKLEKTIGELKDENKKLKTAVDEHKKESGACVARLEAAERKVAELANVASGLRAKDTELVRVVGEANSSLQQVKAAEREAGLLKAAVDSSKATCENVLTRIKTIAADSEADVTAIRGFKTQAEQEFRNVSAVLAEGYGIAEQRQDAISAIEGQRNDAIAAIQAEIAAMNQRVAEAQVARGTLQDILEQLKSEVPE